MKRQTAEREDGGISKLPAPILHHILSFLSQEEAVRTCVLSKSWRHLGSTRPNFSLEERDFGKEKEKFMDVLKTSLQVYFDQKLCIEDFSVTSVSTVDPELESLLEEWIPKVIHDMGAKKFLLSLGYSYKYTTKCFDVPSVVFESESLEELYLERFNLSQINSIGKNNHLKRLCLYNVYIKEETFAKIMSSCPLIEHFSLFDCEGFRTIKMHNHHNLKSFGLHKSGLFSTNIDLCPNWFPGLTFLNLDYVSLSNEWFNSFSRNFPCLEDLHLWQCNGFDELQLSSPSIKSLKIAMDKTTIKATIDAPSIKAFHYDAKISQSISFTTTSSSEWESEILVSLDIDSSLWFPKISELVAKFSQSQLFLVLFHSGRGDHDERIEHLSDISDVCCGGSYKMPVAMKRLEFNLEGRYYDSFFSDLMNGLFRIIRPRAIRQNWYVDAQQDEHERKGNEAFHEFLCRTLQMGRSEDEGMWFWQHDLEEVSLEVFDPDVLEWHPVQGTINWSEYVAALLLQKKNMGYYCELRFRLKWRE